MFQSAHDMTPNTQVKPHRAAGWAGWQALPAAWASLRNDVGLNALLGPDRLRADCIANEGKDPRYTHIDRAHYCTESGQGSGS